MTKTYDRRVQLAASRRCLEDAKALHSKQRWAAAMYLAGYAIECSMISLICYNECKNNFQETRSFKKGIQGAKLHSLAKLLEELPQIKKAIYELDKTKTYEKAWNKITDMWRKDELRYSENQGNEKDSKEFIDAVKYLHDLLLIKQGE